MKPSRIPPLSRRFARHSLLVVNSLRILWEELAELTGQNRTLVRQLLRRMINAGDIIAPAYGLYTTHHHLPPEILFSQNDVGIPTTPATPTTPTTPVGI